MYSGTTVTGLETLSEPPVCKGIADKEFGITFTEGYRSLFHTGYDFETLEHAQEVARAVFLRGNPDLLSERGYRWSWLDADKEFEVTHATIQTKDDDVVTFSRDDNLGI